MRYFLLKRGSVKPRKTGSVTEMSIFISFGFYLLSVSKKALLRMTIMSNKGQHFYRFFFIFIVP